VKMIWELSPRQLKDAGDDASALLAWLASLGFCFTILDDATGAVDPASAEEVLLRCPSDSYVNILSQRNA